MGAPDLDDLDKKLAEASRSHEPTPEQLRDAENMGVGMRAGTELVGAIIAGGLIGWLLDGWLGSKPVFLIIMLLLGVITGFFNVWRVTQNMSPGGGFSQLHKQEKPAKNPADKGESE